MFDFFRKKKRELPPFNDLQVSPLKDKYFARTCPWDWLTPDMIHVYDMHAPRIITMDPWPQTIYLSADGEQTVSDFVYYIASQYGKREVVPDALDKSILESLQGLLDDKLIELSNDEIILPERLAVPLKEVK